MEMQYMQKLYWAYTYNARQMYLLLKFIRSTEHIYVPNRPKIGAIISEK